MGRKTLDELLDEARARIGRLDPAPAWEAVRAGATLVDIRSEDACERDGVVPGSLHVPRTVLEWRLAPDSQWRSPYAPGLGAHLLVICDHGHSSVLAAAALADLGFERVGDVVGGYEAWCEAGLPTAPAQRRSEGERPGMAPPVPPAPTSGA
jgi:rhodanese-related sulfurtransferase